MCGMGPCLEIQERVEQFGKHLHSDQFYIPTSNIYSSLDIGYKLDDLLGDPASLWRFFSTDRLSINVPEADDLEDARPYESYFTSHSAMSPTAP